MEKVFIEENNVYKIDFTSALWATNELNQIFHNAKVQLNDVDFIAETDAEILFVEYKNSNIPNAVKPQEFNPCEDKKINQVVKKYYDSVTYVNALGKEQGKAKIYVYILEAPKADNVLRGLVLTRLKALLPFLLQEQNMFSYKLIDDVKVMSIKKWNEKYAQFPLTKITK